MKQRSNNSKLTLILLSISVALIFATGLVFQQRLAYRNGNHSFIFGQRIAFQQGQSMPFNNISFTTQKTTHVAFTREYVPNCLQNSESAYATSLCINSEADPAEAYNNAETGKLQYQINATAKNTGSSVNSLSQYQFSFDSGSVQVLGKNIDDSGIIPGDSKALSLHTRVPQSTKSANLLIRNNKTTKYFVIKF
jgi:hypothetical protein